MGYFLLTLLVVVTAVYAQPAPRRLEPRGGAPAGPPNGQPRPVLISEPPRPLMPGPNNMGLKNDSNCPPRTGREWVCMVESWDQEQKKVIDSQPKIKCHKDDMCYLGPLMSYPLKGPWERKWMCGPTPCRMTGESGETTMPCKGQNATCSIGPYEIQVNGSKFQAWYCEKKWGMQPEFIPELCSINSSRTGFESINQCDPGESCGRGPIYFWQNATQYRAYLCTKTPPPRPDMKKLSKAMQMLYKIHERVMEIKDYLIMQGFVLHGGPEKSVHDFTWRILDGLSQLWGHLETVEMAKQWGMEVDEEDMKGGMPKIAHDVFMKVQADMKAMYDMMEDQSLFESEDGWLTAAMMMDSYNKLGELFDIVSGGLLAITPDAKPHEIVAFIQDKVQNLRPMLTPQKIQSDEAKKMFMLIHKAAARLNEKIALMPGNGDLMEVFGKFTDRLQTIWNHMSNGPRMPGERPEEILEKLGGPLEKLMTMLSGGAGVDADDLVGQGEAALRDLAQRIAKGYIDNDDSRAAFMKVHQAMGRVKDFAKERGDRQIQDMIQNLGQKMQALWNHMSNGPKMPGESPRDVTGMIQEGFAKLRELMNVVRSKNGTRGGQDGRQGPSPPMQGGPSDQGQVLGQIQRQLQDLLRQVQGQGQGPLGSQGPLGGQGPLAGQGPLGGQGQGPNPMDVAGQIRDMLGQVQREVGGNQPEQPRGDILIRDIAQRIMEMHFHLTGQKPIPSGPQGKILELAQKIKDFMDNSKSFGPMADEIKGALDRLSDGASSLLQLVQNPGSVDPKSIFDKLTDGVKRVVEYRREYGRRNNPDNPPPRPLLDEAIRSLEHMRQSGNSQNGNNRGNSNPLEDQINNLLSQVQNAMRNNGPGNNGPSNNGGYGNGNGWGPQPNQSNGWGSQQGQMNWGQQYNQGESWGPQYQSNGWGPQQNQGPGQMISQITEDLNKAQGMIGEMMTARLMGGHRLDGLDNVKQMADRIQQRLGQGGAQLPATALNAFETLKNNIANMEKLARGEPCDTEFWLRMLPGDEKNKWAPGPNFFSGPDPNKMGMPGLPADRPPPPSRR